jgi:hypothetical protein
MMMNTSYNFEKTAQLIMKSTQGEAAMGRMSKQASHKEPGILPKLMGKLGNKLIVAGKNILAVVEKETVLNS